MNTFALFILLIGVFFIIVGYYKNYKNCPPTKIEYRYIPRSFWDEYSQDDTTLSQFYNMFNDNSPLESNIFNQEESSEYRNNYNNLFKEDNS